MNDSKVATVEAQAVPTKEQANDALETLEGWDDGWGPDPRPKAFATLRRFIEQSRPTPAAADLHQQVMNLPCEVPTVVDDMIPVTAFRMGFKAARHAAAELVAAQPSGNNT